jgi:PEP-CTERM putative exosortase interaction domain
MNKTQITSALTIASLALASSLSAETLASWDYSSNFAATTEASYIIASDTTLGTFNGTTGATGRSGGNGGTLFSRLKELSGAGGDTVIFATEANAISTNSYFEFTLTPNGENINITSFSADVFAQTLAGDPQAEYTVNYLLRSSEDSYASNLLTASHTAPATDGSGDTTTPTAFSGTLSGFDNISSAVTFRIYAYATTATKTSEQTLRIDNVTFSGSTIPEPSQAAMLLGGISVALVALRRRKK